MATKPFYFAWVEPTDTTFGASHYVVDERVYSFALAHSEGDFPTVELDVRNPRVGLLATGRKIWAWLSWDRGAAQGGAPGVDVVPLFFGRLVGVPQQVQAELVRLLFVARPGDYVAQKTALADTLKVAPFWDPVWVAESKRNVPDTVLEARTQLWHIDRVSHVVTVSDIIDAEDGSMIFGPSDVPYDSVNVAIGDPPLRRVTVSARIGWAQAGFGSFNLSARIAAAAAAANSGEGGRVWTFTGDGLIKAWPQAGAGIGAGWSVQSGNTVPSKATIENLESVSLIRNLFNNIPPTDQFNAAIAKSPFGLGDVFQDTVNLRPFLGLPLGSDSSRHLAVPVWRVVPNLVVGYEVSRARAELVTFTLEADVQSVATLPEDGEEEVISLESNDVGDPLDLDEDNPTSGDLLAPIRDIRRRAYLPTDRGRESLVYLITLARARLLARSRVVQVSFGTRFEALLEASCRKNAVLTDDRLPGGQALGKIIAYSLTCDGNSGALRGEVTMACAIGRDGSITIEEGEPEYCEEEYVGDDYQFFTGATYEVVPGAVGYEEFSIPPNDDGLNMQGFTAAEAVLSISIVNGYGDQRAVLDAGQASIFNNFMGYQNPDAVGEAIRGVPTQITVNMRPLTGGPFETAYPIIVTDLKVPKMIDLEAA